MTRPLKYEKPALISLNSDRAETAMGHCTPGSGDTGKCQAGLNAGNTCGDGTGATTSKCESGTSASRTCSPTGSGVT